jgi:hypothetical protein
MCDAIKMVPARNFPVDDDEELDLLEYVAKLMFVLRKQPWVQSLSYVIPRFQVAVLGQRR